MAKKSARSKGYRTYKKVEKGFSKQEIRTMIIGFAVIVLIVIGILVVPDMIEARHLLKVKDGVVQAEENWLVRDVSETSKNKYRKIAEVTAPAEGYQLKNIEDGLTDVNEKFFYYEPAEGTEGVEYYVMTGNGEYSELVANSQNYLSMVSTEILNVGEIVEEEINGMKAAYYISEYGLENASAAAEATEEAAEETTEEAAEEVAVVMDYYQTCYLYVDTNIDNVCVVLCAEHMADSADAFGDGSDLVELLKSGAAGVVMAE